MFVKIATHISRDGKLEVVGKKIDAIKEIKDIKPVINSDSSQIIGSVIYIDNYGNVVTNITQKTFNEISKSRSFTIHARNVKFNKIYNSYSDAIDYSIAKEKREEDGKKIALFNNLGYLELSIYKSNSETVGSASTLFGLNYRDQILDMIKEEAPRALIYKSITKFSQLQLDYWDFFLREKVKPQYSFPVICKKY